MNLLDAKVIQARFEKEIFIDYPTYIHFKSDRSANHPTPTQFLIGLEFGRIREQKFYGTELVYFGIAISEDQVFIVDPVEQSIFAARNEEEKKAVTQLIEYVLTESIHFKKVLKESQSVKSSLPITLPSEAIGHLLNLQKEAIQFKLNGKRMSDESI